MRRARPPVRRCAAPDRRLARRLAVSELYIKVSFPPYIVHIDLAHAVDETKCSAKVKARVLRLTVPKVRCASARQCRRGSLGASAGGLRPVGHTL